MELNNDVKVDTQTTENAQNQDAQNQNAERQETVQQSNENQVTEKQDEQDKVSKAFGNEITKKNEVEKGKKTNSVAKANEDGSITFKNQEELNGFIDRIYRKGVNNQEENNNGGSAQEKKNNEGEKTQNAGKDANISEATNAKVQYPDDYFTSKVAIAMAKQGVIPSKLERASRLVDMDKVVVNGMLDDAKLMEEINATIADFPELKNETSSPQEKGFKFGASKEDSHNNGDGEEISRIFGNKKD